MDTKVAKDKDKKAGRGVDEAAAKEAPPDRGEGAGLLEPLLVSDTSRHRAALSDLALELTAESTRLRTALPDGIASALATLVRAMNCYYSNLIEGHDTHPVDIERALAGDFSAEPKQRNLQLEAKAHIEVQKWIDEGGLVGRATSESGVREIHERFCAHLPPELLLVEDKETGEKHDVIPGAYRVREVIVDDVGGRMSVCSDTDYCRARRQAGHVGAQGVPGEAAE